MRLCLHITTTATGGVVYYMTKKEEQRNKFRQNHSQKVADYVLGLKSLPEKEEFIRNYASLTSLRDSPSKKRKLGRRNYDFIVRFGLV